jgi:ABC-type branched-subunit amino acid transport system ATPase component
VIVECRGVSKSFGDRLAVDQLDLNVPEGLCFGLLGPNGASATIRPTNLEDVFLKLTGTNLEAHENGASQSHRCSVSFPHAFAIWRLNLLPNFFEPLLYLLLIIAARVTHHRLSS